LEAGKAKETILVRSTSHFCQQNPDLFGLDHVDRDLFEKRETSARVALGTQPCSRQSVGLEAAKDRNYMQLEKAASQHQGVVDYVT